MTLLDKLVALLPNADERLVRKQTQIAGQIYHLLNRKNWKQRDLANMAGLKESYVSRVLAGDVNLTLESITKMEAALDEDVIAIPLYYMPEVGVQFEGFGVALYVNFPTASAMAPQPSFRMFERPHPEAQASIVLTPTEYNYAQAA